MLLTALGDEKDMLEGLENGADAYITKPFSINVLRANIRNILANRALLKRAYAGLEDGVGQVPPDCHNTRDWKFMASVRECVMKNIDNPRFLCGHALWHAEHEPHRIFQQVEGAHRPCPG